MKNIIEKHNLTLKSVKLHQDRRTGHVSVQANIYSGKKLVCYADDDGWGGGTVFDFVDDSLLEDIQSECEDVPITFEDIALAGSLDTLLDELLSAHENAKLYRKVIKKLSWICKGDNGITSTKLNLSELADGAIAHYKGKYSDAIFLNDLSKDEAIAIIEGLDA